MLPIVVVIRVQFSHRWRRQLPRASPNPHAPRQTKPSLAQNDNEQLDKKQDDSIEETNEDEDAESPSMEDGLPNNTANQTFVSRRKPTKNLKASAKATPHPNPESSKDSNEKHEVEEKSNLHKNQLHDKQQNHHHEFPCHSIGNQTSKRTDAIAEFLTQKEPEKPVVRPDIQKSLCCDPNANPKEPQTME